MTPEVVPLPFVLTIALAAAGILLTMLLIKLIKTPVRWAFKLLLNAIMGYAALFVLNFFGSWVGLGLGVNWINAIVIGVLGFPGLVLLLLVKYLL